jgi:preprotein translocase subunit SecE
MADIIKYILGGLLLAGGIVAFNTYQDYPTLVRVIGIIVVFVVAAVIFLSTTRGKRVWTLLVEARQEARKVIWPSTSETHKTTAIVIVAVFIVGLMLWAVDSLLVIGVRWFTGS